MQNTAGQLRSHKNGGSGGAKVSEHSEAIIFADVAGVDEAKEELDEIVEFIWNPDRYTKLGARPPRGVLLIDRHHGPLRLVFLGQVETHDRLGREAILKVHATKQELPLGEDVDLTDIASMATGFTVY